MSDFRVGSGPFFARGIEKILYQSLGETEGLPDFHDISPADRARRPMLEQLLAMETLDSFLDDAVRPDVDDLDLLLPAAFHAAMLRVLDRLKLVAERRRRSDKRAASRLDRAVRLLSDEMTLRELLQMYRNALLQG